MSAFFIYTGNILQIYAKNIVRKAEKKIYKKSVFDMDGRMRLTNGLKWNFMYRIDKIFAFYG